MIMKLIDRYPLCNCDEKKTSRNISFVSIHNSLYTQCIGAPIKKKSFFSNRFFSNISLKSHRFCCFFPPTESKEKLCTTNKQQQNMSCKSTPRHAHIHFWNENQNLIKKTRAAACCYLEHYVTQTAFHI